MANTLAPREDLSEKQLLEEILKELKELRRKSNLEINKVPFNSETIANQLYHMENAALFKMPQTPPYQKLRLYATAAGNLINNNLLTIPPGADVEILRWEYAPAHITLTELGVAMPDLTLPFVDLVVNFDRKTDIYDWTIEEYQNVLGLTAAKTPVPLYGGCTRYDAVTFHYASITQWDYLTDDYLQVRVHNWTAVPVVLDSLAIEFWSTAELSHLRKYLWGGPLGF